MRSFGKWILLAAAAWLSPAYAQDMMDHVDLSSPKFSSAEMTRAEIETIIKTSPHGGLDFSGKSLNGLDLSGLDFTGANFRAARMNRAKLSGAKFDGALLDQVWAIAASFSGASLKNASLFGSQAARGELRRGRSFGCPRHRRFVARQSARCEI